MKTYQVIKVDKFTKEVEKIKNVKCEESELFAILADLQSGYCEGEEPETGYQTVGDGKGNNYHCLISESDCDFVHIAVLNRKGM